MAAPLMSTRSTLTPPARVLIADSYDLFAIGAAKTLEWSGATRGVQTVIVDNIRQAEIRLRQESFDVVLIGDSLLQAPEQNLKALHTARPVMIGVIYDTLDPAQAAEYYRSGVRAIVSRRISVESLCETLDKILAGGEIIDSDALEAVLLSIKLENCGKQQEVDSDTLTRKEQKIAFMIATTGKRNKEIAADLSMTEQVVKNHLRSIFVKMKVDSRIQLALKLLHSESGSGAISAVE